MANITTAVIYCRISTRELVGLNYHGNLPQYCFIRIFIRGCIIKLFTAIINSAVQKASAFAIGSHLLLALTNTLAFYVTELITAVIIFMIQAPGANPIKLFTAEIYGFS